MRQLLPFNRKPLARIAWGALGAMALTAACSNDGDSDDDVTPVATGGDENVDENNNAGAPGSGGSETGGTGSGGTDPTGGGPNGSGGAMGGTPSMGGMGGEIEPPPTGPTHFLPASGQTACTADLDGWGWDPSCAENYSVGSPNLPFGQDAQHQADYLPISLSVTDAGETITDQVTGLIWERCSAGQSLAEGACGGTVTDDTFAAAVAHCATLSTGGHTWRVPTAVEHSTIINWAFFGPVMDPTYFPDTPSTTRYWTTSGGATDRYVQWMFGGDLTPLAVTSSRSARCVSGEPFGPSFEVTPEGPVVDTKTHLELTPCPLASGGATPVVASAADCSDASDISGWPSALEACENLNYAGHDDWRLLSARDLGYIHDFSNEGPLDSQIFPGIADQNLFTSTSGPSGNGGAMVSSDPALIRPNQGKGASQAVYCIRSPDSD